MKKPPLLGFGRHFVIVLTVALIQVPFSVRAADQPPSGYAGPVAQQPTFVVGEKWSYTGFSGYSQNQNFEYTLVYEGRRGDLHVFDSRSPKRSPYKMLYTSDMSSARSEGRSPELIYSPHSGWLKFPIFVGKKWTHAYTREQGRGPVERRRQIEVVGFEKLTVGAGTFDAFHLKGINQRLDRAYPAFEDYWYAPKLRAIIKYESQEFSFSFELQKFEAVVK